MSGGKGGKQTTEVKIPAWLESAARQNMSRANEIAQIGYTPYFGPDVAGFTPMQQAAFQNANNAASAFGLSAPTDAMAGMPQAQTFAGGVQGYSSAPLYLQSLEALAAARPGQYAALNAPFINPVTGADPAKPFGSYGGGGGGGGANVATDPISAMFNRMTSGGGGTTSPSEDYVSQSRNASPYTSFGDMFDGGGPGRSGPTYEGGGVVSKIGNSMASGK